MIRETVSSSELRSVGYENTMILEIEFQNGGVYQYFEVPEVAHAELMSASSKGRYFNQNIRNVYRCKRVH